MRTVSPMKQLSRVLTAIESGALTSTDVSQVTGLPVKRCSSHLSALADYGLIQKTGRTMKYASRSHVSYCYEVRRG